MNGNPSEKSRVSWTWADQLSTYRFWGLLLFYTLSITGANFVFVGLPLILNRQHTTLIFTTSTLAGLCGFFLAWASTQWRTVSVLAIACVLALLGTLLFVVPVLASSSALLLLGAVSFGIGTSAVALGVPAALADGKGGAESFVVAFGIILTVSKIVQAGSTSPIVNRFGPSAVVLGAAGSMFLGLLFLLPVKTSLFNKPPLPRGYPLTPTYRSPIAVALLSPLFPYALYWFYRAHGEVTSLKPSPAILSPRGSIGAFFVPLLFPIAMTSLIQTLNERAVEQGKSPFRSPSAVFLWSLFFYPRGMALVQSAINQSLPNNDQTI